MLQVAEQVKDPPDWLPDGWILEVKTQKSGIHIGRQSKCYYDPSSGSRFYSKRAVFRHLKSKKHCSAKSKRTRRVTAESMNKACTPIDQEKDMEKNSIDNVIHEYAPKGLPHGWIKEIRLRKRKSKSKVKKDPFYIDPVNGYVFRSLKDARRYIETGDIQKCVIKPTKRSCCDTSTVEKEIHSPTAAKRLDLHGNAIKRCLFSDETPDIDAKMEMEINESSDKSPLPPLGHASTTKEADFNCKQLASGNLEEAVMTDPCDKVQSSGQMLGSENESDLEPAMKTEPNSAINNLIKVQNQAPEALDQPLWTKQLDEDAEGQSSMLEEKPHGAEDVMPLVLDNMKSIQSDNKGSLASQVRLSEETKLELSTEDQSQPKKPRRGRPPKAQEKPHGAEDVMPGVLDNMKSVQSDNKGSLASQVRLSEETKLELSTVDQSQPKKRRRGRPPKAQEKPHMSRMLEEKPHGAEDVMPVVLDNMKSIQSDNKGSLASQVRLSEETKLELSTEDQSQPKKRRRGRPPKAQEKPHMSRMLEEKPHGAEDVMPVVLDNMKSIQSDNKGSLASQVRLLEETKLELSTEDQAQPKKRRRGRPRKAQEKPHMSRMLEEKPHGADVMPVVLDNMKSIQSDNKGSLASQIRLSEETKLELSTEDQSQPKKPRRGRPPKGTRMPVRASERLAALRANSLIKSGIADVPPEAAMKYPDEPKVESTEVLNIAGSAQKLDCQNELSTTIVKPFENINCKNLEVNVLEQIDFQSPITDKEESLFASPFGDSWPDPCIEFAFKTLTGDIPFLEDTAAIQNFFHQQLDSNKSQSLGTSSGCNKLENQMEAQNQCIFSSKDNGGPCSLANGMQSIKKVN